MFGLYVLIVMYDSFSVQMKSHLLTVVQRKDLACRIKKFSVNLPSKLVIVLH